MTNLVAHREHHSKLERTGVTTPKSRSEEFWSTREGRYLITFNRHSTINIAASIVCTSARLGLKSTQMTLLSILCFKPWILASEPSDCEYLTGPRFPVSFCSDSPPYGKPSVRLLSATQTPSLRTMGNVLSRPLTKLLEHLGDFDRYSRLPTFARGQLGRFQIWRRIMRAIAATQLAASSVP